MSLLVKGIKKIDFEQLKVQKNTPSVALSSFRENQHSGVSLLEKKSIKKVSSRNGLTVVKSS